MKARLAGFLGVLVLTCPVLRAADFWVDKDFMAWSSREVEKMLTHSPWSHTVTVLAPDLSLAGRVGGLTGGVIGNGGRAGRAAGGGGVAGDGAGNIGGGSFLASPRRTQLAVRWASALPVRQARARAELRADATTVLAAALQLLTEDEPFYRVAVVGVSQELAQAVESLNDLWTATALKRRNEAPIEPVDILLAYEGDLLTMEFHFPRTDAITLADQEVEFTTRLGQSGVKNTFKLKDMVFDGRLAL